MTDKYFGCIVVKGYGSLKIIDKETFDIAKIFLKMMENEVMKDDKRFEDDFTKHIG